MRRNLAALLLVLGAALPAHPAAPRPTYTRNVAIVLYEDVELLDFAGPFYMFRAYLKNAYGSAEALNKSWGQTVIPRKPPMPKAQPARSEETGDSFRSRHSQ